MNAITSTITSTSRSTSRRNDRINNPRNGGRIHLSQRRKDAKTQSRRGHMVVGVSPKRGGLAEGLKTCAHGVNVPSTIRVQFLGEDEGMIR